MDDRKDEQAEDKQVEQTDHVEDLDVADEESEKVKGGLNFAKIEIDY